MAGRIRHFLERDGRYFARLVVPKQLRSIVGKTELRTPLGGDRRSALKRLPSAVAELQKQIAAAEQKLGAGRSRLGQPRYPLSPDQMALSHYQQRLAFDDELRADVRYAPVSIDDILVQRLREAVAGRATDADFAELVGNEIERFRAAGNHDAHPGTLAWRQIARALCHAELEALARAAERDEGDFTGRPALPMLSSAQLPEEISSPVSLKELWADYVYSRVQAGFMRDKGKRQNPVIRKLGKFLKHDDARRVTKKDLLAWRDHLMAELTAKTVNDIYLSTVRSLFAWAVENDRLLENVASAVKQPKPKKVYGRERGFTDSEAEEILTASRRYQPTADRWGNVREGCKSVNMKRWVPILCAFSGARVSEMTQLRKEDLRQVDRRWIMRITPAAGTIKAGDYRDVPLHKQIIDEGFMDFVLAESAGPLFHNQTDPDQFGRAAGIVSNKLSDWLRESKLTPVGLQPNHGWRHRLKTQCRELGISDRVIDALQGHAGKTAGDNYGDVTLKTKIEAISRLPSYALSKA